MLHAVLLNRLSALSQIQRRLARCVGWNLLATLTTQGAMFLCSIIVARLLGKQVFGEYAVIYNTLTTATNLLQFSLGGTATKYVAEFRTTDKQAAGRVIALCALITVITGALGVAGLCAASHLIAASVLRAQSLQSPLILGAAFLFFSGVCWFQVGILAALESYKELAYSGVWSGIATACAMALGAELGGLSGAMAALVAASSIRVVIQQHYLRRAIREQRIQVSLAGASSVRRIISNFALPAALCNIFTLPIMWAAQAILARQQSGFEQVAVYSAATSFRVLILYVPQVINAVGLTLLNNARGAADMDVYKRTFAQNAWAVCGVATACTLAAFALSGPALSLFGNSFQSDRVPLFLLLASTAPESATIVLHQLVQSQERLWSALVFVNIPRDTTFFLLTLVLAPRSGARGMAMGYLLASVVGLLGTATIAHGVWKRIPAGRRVEPSLCPQ